MDWHTLGDILKDLGDLLAGGATCEGLAPLAGPVG